MRKLCLLLALASAAACHSPKEATQTIVAVNATPSMQALIKSVQLTAYTWPQMKRVSDESLEPPTWPVRRTFAPRSAQASHGFKLLFTATDQNDQPLAKLDLRAVVIEGASRYVYVTLDEQCLQARCPDGVCVGEISAEQLSTASEAFDHVWYCGLDGMVQPSSPPVHTVPDKDKDKPPPGASQGTAVGSAVTGQSGATTTSGAGNAAPSAGGDSTPSTADASTSDATTFVPASMDECGGTCAAHETCGLDTQTMQYECRCEPGYERDANGTSCVLRDDCQKDKGGCDGTCVRAQNGAAECSCPDPNTWLKSDLHGCGEVKPAMALSTGAGSLARTQPQVAFDAAGNGLVVWSETRDDGSTSLWSARYHGDTKRWDAPRLAVFLAPSADDLALALDPTGAGVLLWTSLASSGGHRQLWATNYRNGAFAVRAQQLDKDMDGDVLMPALALDAMGDGLVAWTVSQDSGSALGAARYQASSDSWELVAANAAEPTSFYLGTSVALDNLNNGLITWSAFPVVMGADGGADTLDFSNAAAFNLRLEADRKTLGTALGFDSGSSPTASVGPDVVVDAQGKGTAVWLQAGNPGTSSMSVVSRVYLPGQGWNSQQAQVLATTARWMPTPRVAVGPDGAVFAAWQQASSSTEQSTWGALRVAGDTFESPQELGLRGETPYWAADSDSQSWSVETLRRWLQYAEPSWDLAVGPNHEGFIVGASFDTSQMPPRRKLWLQRAKSQAAPSEAQVFTAADSVPAMPSAPQLALNSNGDGAIVWDRQVQGHYFVFVSMLQ